MKLSVMHLIFAFLFYAIPMMGRFLRGDDIYTYHQMIGQLQGIILFGIMALYFQQEEKK